MNDRIMCCGENKKTKKKGDVLREQSLKWFEAPICQRKRGEERRAERQTEKEGEKERQGGIDKLKTACGCTDTGCETDKKKGDRGGKRQSTETGRVKE